MRLSNGSGNALPFEKHPAHLTYYLIIGNWNSQLAGAPKIRDLSEKHKAVNPRRFRSLDSVPGQVLRVRKYSAILKSFPHEFKRSLQAPPVSEPAISVCLSPFSFDCESNPELSRSLAPPYYGCERRVHTPWLKLRKEVDLLCQ
jgi:hypothetical protein